MSNHQHAGKEQSAIITSSSIYHSILIADVVQHNAEIDNEDKISFEGKILAIVLH